MIQPGAEPQNQARPRQVEIPVGKAGDDSAEGVEWKGSRRTLIAERRSSLNEPRTVVLLVVGSVMLLGGGRRLFHAWRARRGVARLLDPEVIPEEVLAAAEYGRAGLPELFRILGDPSPAFSAEHREAAGRALALLWAQDHLIAEEEQGLVLRGFAAAWNARRRYPRALGAEIPISVRYGVPFLAESGSGVGPANLEWSHRVTGSRRASLEDWSDWVAGPGRMSFRIVPGDFETNGPHRLVLQTRVRTRGLTDAWQIELPHAPFQFEYDPRLEVGSLLAQPDEGRREAMAKAVRLEVSPSGKQEHATFLHLNPEFAIRNPPRLVVQTPLPCDLAHGLLLELEGVAGRIPAGQVVLSGQGIPRGDEATTLRSSRCFDIGPLSTSTGEVLDRPGIRRMRLILDVEEALGWTDAEIRSVWPGTLATDWIPAEVVRS